MTRREEIISIAGQAINGMLSADSTMLTKLLDRTIHKKISETAVSIAEDVINRIDKIEKEQPK